MARRGIHGAVMKILGARDYEVTVTGTELITPEFRRVHFSADKLFTDVPVLPAAWLRFWFPDPERSDVEHMRAYTIAEADEASGTFSVDFVLHEPSGPGSGWAKGVKPGDTVSLMSAGTTVFEVPNELPRGYLLIGDRASIPAINSILRAIPSSVPVELYLEEQGSFDHQIPMTNHPHMRTHWIARSGPESLAAAIEPLDWSGWYAWASPESRSLKHVRQRLKNEFGFPKSCQQLLAYWVRGREMGRVRSKKAGEISEE